MALLKIGSLWQKEDKNGNTMFSGNIDIPADITLTGDNTLMVFTNDRKNADNHPDFEVYVGKKEDR